MFVDMKNWSDYFTKNGTPARCLFLNLCYLLQTACEQLHQARLVVHRSQVAQTTNSIPINLYWDCIAIGVIKAQCNHLKSFQMLWANKVSMYYRIMDLKPIRRLRPGAFEGLAQSNPTPGIDWLCHSQQRILPGLYDWDCKRWQWEGFVTSAYVSYVFGS